MVDGVNASFSLSLRGKYRGVGDLSVPQVELAPIHREMRLERGTAFVGKGDLQFSDIRSLVSGTAETLDLSGGLSDQFGNVIAFEEVTAIFIEADAPLVIGGGSFAGPLGAGGAVPLAADAVKYWVSKRGWQVIAGTGDGLTIENKADEDATYSIVIVGRSERVPVLSISGVPEIGDYGVTYEFTPTATGGSGAKVFSLETGSLPVGWSFSSSTGTITGSSAGDLLIPNLRIRVTDASGYDILGPFSIVISDLTPDLLNYNSAANSGAAFMYGVL